MSQHGSVLLGTRARDVLDRDVVGVVAVAGVAAETSSWCQRSAALRLSEPVAQRPFRTLRSLRACRWARWPRRPTAATTGDPDQEQDASWGHCVGAPSSRYKRFELAVVQVKPELGTGPFDVGGLNVQFTVSTSSPGSKVPLALESWNCVIVAEWLAAVRLVMVGRGAGMRQ